MSLEQKVLTDWIVELFTKQQHNFRTLRKAPVKDRKKNLSLLKDWILHHRREIQEAVYNDFQKPSVEVDATEIFPVLDEIKLAIDNVDRWAKPKKVDAPITMLGTRSSIVYEPRGVCLIISPWNYPFNLCIGPLVSALAAGNSAIIKPSEMTPHTSSLIKKMCDEIFDEKLVAVCEGGVEISQTLLALPFDHIFFTGSPAIGKVVMRAASEHLTSVTLELGGKSPVVVSASARIKEAAERIAVAKFINNGQTCIAPDYALVHESVRDKFIDELKKKTLAMFAKPGQSMKQSPHYARIVNEKHANRLSDLLQDAVDKGASFELSGEVDLKQRFFHPIVLSNVSPDSKIMEEEIFGPILPVVSYTDFDEVITFIDEKPKPLALYYFGNSSAERKRIKSETSSGGICVNDCAIHFLNHNLPFGGINNSGIGKSHGYYGFLAFSNEKPVLKQRNGYTSVKFLYPPYTSRVKTLVNWLLKMLSI